MKKIILMVMAIASFSANAAIIEISTDKTIYQVGETITATVSFSNEDAFLGMTPYPQSFDVYSTTIGFNESLLSFIGASTSSDWFIHRAISCTVCWRHSNQWVVWFVYFSRHQRRRTDTYTSNQRKFHHCTSTSARNTCFIAFGFRRHGFRSQTCEVINLNC